MHQAAKKQSDSGLIHAANNLLRTTLIELAHRLVRYDERWQELYEKLKFNGKPICVAICAIANRFTRCLHHKMKEVEIRLEEASQKKRLKAKEINETACFPNGICLVSALPGSCEGNAIDIAICHWERARETRC